MTTHTPGRNRVIVLTIASVLFGAALGVPLWIVSTVLLGPFMGFAAADWGIWMAFGITVVLGIVAGTRLALRKDRVSYRHAVLGGLMAFMTVLAVIAVVEYGFSTSSRSMPTSTMAVLDEF